MRGDGERIAGGGRGCKRRRKLFQEQEQLVVGDGLAIFEIVAGAEWNEAIVGVELGEFGVPMFHFQKHDLAADALLRDSYGIFSQFKQFGSTYESALLDISVFSDLGN